MSANSFTNGKPHVATAEDLKRPWGGKRDGSRFRCYLCGHRFKAGDTYRWQFTNDVSGAGGNPLVCKACDGPDVIEHWKAMHAESREKWWWFIDQEVIRGEWS